MKNYIKTLIAANKDAVLNIATLEEVIENYIVNDEKSKVNFGNICILLNGYRNIAKATECLLINEKILKGNDGEYYQKIKDDVIVPPTTEDKPGSDFDIDKRNKDE